ncbi:MAG: hypothetical protein E7353_01185 [Clostridiales bacterium]|nr:hypothetical protein [Clostridiales bacterium]
MKAKTYHLNENWFITTDPKNVGINDNWQNAIQESCIPAFVPSIIQQFFPAYHGVAWYWNTFKNTLSMGNDRVLLRFGGVDYKATVWLNGILLGSYEGGETPFDFDVTDYLKEDNLLAVRVLNPSDKMIDGMTLMSTPHRNKVMKPSAGSNFNHGGIWYGVTLECVPEARISDKMLVGDIKGNLTAFVTVLSEFANEEKANLSLTVYEKSGTNAIRAQKDIEISIQKGENNFELTTFVEQVELWDCDNPYLYTVEIILKGKDFEHKYKQSFGFREFCVKDGYFYLNGKKIFIKSAHSGNAFPIGQGFPVHPGQVRQDFVYAKACGFNMLRAIAGLFRPEQLDIADELGLLVYEESLASWCVAYSQWNFWNSREEFEEIRKRRAVTDMPIDNIENIVQRWKNSNTCMINRDKNHTCVVVWGLLNETLRNDIFYTAVDYIKELRAIDKTRLVLLNSGRFDYDHSIGSASNPYSDSWDNVMGSDGDESQNFWGKWNDSAGYIASTPNAGDHHRYSDAPVDYQMREWYKTLGKNAELPIFLSEFGIGSLFNVIEEYKHFIQYGYSEELEDYAWLKRQGDALEKDWERLGLKKVFPFAESFLKESQHKNAKERKNLFDVLRANNYLSGYSLTGLLDHGMCGEGLWSYWRRFKPEMFDAISDGWAKLRFCILPTRCAQVGENVEFEAYLANDGVLKSGEYHATFAITSDDGVIATFDKTFTINGDDFSTFILKERAKIEKAGTYKILASLKEGSPAGFETEFYVIDKPKRVDACVKLVGVEENVQSLLSSYGVTSDESDVIIAGNVNDKEIENLIEKVKNGSTVAFVDVSVFKGANNEKLLKLREIIPDLTVFDGRDWLYHKELVVANKDVFDGLSKKIVDLDVFIECFPHVVFKTNQTPTDVICPGFQTGYHCESGAYGLYHAIEGFKVGKGMIYLFTFPLNRNYCFDRLFMNFVQYLSKRN